MFNFLARLPWQNGGGICFWSDPIKLRRLHPAMISSGITPDFSCSAHVLIKAGGGRLVKGDPFCIHLPMTFYPGPKASPLQGGVSQMTRNDYPQRGSTKAEY